MTKRINKNDKPRSQRVLKTEAISAKLISSPYGAKRVQTDDTHINPHIKEQKTKTKPRLKWVLRDLGASWTAEARLLPPAPARKSHVGAKFKKSAPTLALPTVRQTLCSKRYVYPDPCLASFARGSVCKRALMSKGLRGLGGCYLGEIPMKDTEAFFLQPLQHPTIFGKH